MRNWNYSTSVNTGDLRLILDLENRLETGYMIGMRKLVTDLSSTALEAALHVLTAGRNDLPAKAVEFKSSLDITLVISSSMTLYWQWVLYVPSVWVVQGGRRHSVCIKCPSCSPHVPLIQLTYGTLCPGRCDAASSLALWFRSRRRAPNSFHCAGA